MHGIQLTIKNSPCAWPDRLLPSCPAWGFEKFLLMNSTGDGTQLINCQRMFRWMWGGRGKAETPSQGADGRPVTYEGTLYLWKLKCDRYFFSCEVFSKGCPVSKVENSRTDDFPQGSTTRREHVSCSESMQKEPENFLCSAPRVTLPNCAVWSEPRGFCRFVFGVFPSWPNCSVLSLRDSCFLIFFSRKACCVDGLEGTWRSRDAWRLWGLSLNQPNPCFPEGR